MALIGITEAVINQIKTFGCRYGIENLFSLLDWTLGLFFECSCTERFDSWEVIVRSFNRPLITPVFQRKSLKEREGN